MELAFIKTAFATLFVAIDPLGLATIFLALTAHMTAADRKRTAFRSVSIAFGILFAAILGGASLLTTLGISMPAFRIAGGLLLFTIAAEMVFEKRVERKSNSAEAASQEHPDKIAAFPLAIPLMAGPGAITAAILQASNVSGNTAALITLIVILAAVLAMCLIVFLLATPIDRILGTTGRIIMSRLLGVLLAALAVQIIGEGVLAFLKN